jgi:iron(III) transport system ATP-binding protein
VNLSRQYGGVNVVDSISFDVPDGSVCTLLGASGSGKTTTLRVIAGLDRPDGGEVWIGERLVASSRTYVPPERRDVGLMFQSYALWPHMTVFDQLAYPLKVRRIDRRERKRLVEHFAEVVGMADYLDRLPSELSGGQQQRVALARAVVFGPSVLLLDEPLSGLDASLRRETRLELLRVQRELGITTLFVTHDQEEAMAMSDRVVVMSGGQILSIGSPRECYDEPATPFAARFVGASNLLDARVAELRGPVVACQLPDGTVIEGGPLAPMSQGNAVVVVVKPVDIELWHGDESAPNVVPGDLKSVTYLGPRTELLVRVGGDEVRIEVERGTSAATLPSRILLHFPEHLVRVLPAQ